MEYYLLRPCEVPEITGLRQSVAAYMKARILVPCKGSVFHRKWGWAVCLARFLPAEWLMNILSWHGYGGLVAIYDGVIMGHIVWQCHGTTQHMFSVKVTAQCPVLGYGQGLLREFILRAHGCSGIKSVRIGGGGDQAVILLYDRAAQGKLELPFSVRPGTNYWLHFDKE